MLALYLMSPETTGRYNVQVSLARRVIGPSVFVHSTEMLVVNIGEFKTGCVNIEVLSWSSGFGVWAPLSMLKVSCRMASLMTCSTGEGPARFSGIMPELATNVRCVGVGLIRPVRVVMNVGVQVLADFHLADEFVIEEEYFEIV